MAFQDRCKKIYDEKKEHQRLIKLFVADPTKHVESSVFSDQRVERVRGTARTIRRQLEHIPDETPEDYQPYVDYHFFGVAEYILHGDVGLFRENMALAAACTLHIFEQYDAGKIDYPFDGGYIAMIAFKELLDGLASGDFDISTALAGRMGVRDEFEGKHDSEYSLTLGYSLKHCVLGEMDELRQWLPKFDHECQTDKELVPMRGYPKVFQAILDKNVELANEGIASIAEGHIILARRPSWFKETEDEMLSVRGIGMANLARRYGLGVDAAPPFIPADLLIDVAERA